MINNNLIKSIKQKKELSNTDDQFIKKHLQEFLKQNPKIKKQLEPLNPKSSAYKITVKSVRAILRRLYGLFRGKDDIIDVDKVIDELKETKKLKSKNTKEENKHKIMENILKKHSSTKERLSFYPELYKKIFKITGIPKSILDLGCGINPLSFIYMNLNEIKYYAYDINEDEIKLIHSFFLTLNKGNKKIKATVQVKDISQKQTFPKTDLCFLFKVTDILDKGKNHKPTENIIKNIPAKHIIISFPTLTMSGKKMNAPRRKWMEWMCKRLKYKYQILEFSNELFYVLEK